MKRIHILLVSFLFLIIQSVTSQNAPVTTAGSELAATPGPITIPVTAYDFENIGSITLTLLYDTAVITFTGGTPNPALSSMAINSTTPGEVSIGWFSISGGITLPGISEICELSFNFKGGTSTLSWDNTSSGGVFCEYTDGLFAPLNDLPTGDYYSDGLISDHTSPVTYAPTITNANSGPVNVPVTVDNFTDICSIALALEYDPAILTFTGGIPNPVFGTDMIVSSLPSSGGKRKVMISWISSPMAFIPETLADGSTLVTIKFDYEPVLFTGNYSELEWLTDGTACEYGDSLFNPLYDLPYDDFYIDGIVAGQVAPGTYLPENTTADAVNPVSVPVTVVGLQNIGTIALAFVYDTAVIRYVGYTPNAVFGIPPVAPLVLSNQVNGSTGKITISYFGSSVTIADLDYIADIEFAYISGTTTLRWITDGTACEYADASFNPLWDEPYEDYYFDGLISGKVSPMIKADSVSAAPGTVINVPLRVWDFTDISSLTLTMDYNPGVLTYIDASPHPDISYQFTNNAMNPGRIQIGWFNSNPIANQVNLPDETVLIYLNFTYHGGTTPLMWFDDGASCEFTAGSTYTPLYDLPTPDYFIDGLVEEAGFIWIGVTSDEWYVASNWSGNLVPTALSKVSIPSTPPPFWPLYDGNFTLGDQCSSIAFDISSEMTVNGDMIIDPGKKFINAGSGILRVGGDWLNSGVFEWNTGNVNFFGNIDGNIPAGVMPAQVVQNYALSTEPASMTPLTGGTAGPAGDNTHSDVGIGFSFNYAGTTYTSARINTNGWLSLNQSGTDAVSGDNNRLFFSSDPAYALAPWWDNLLADISTNISYLTAGTAPNRVFTVEWNNILAYSTVSTTRLNFQVKLYESTDIIEFCYGTVSAGTINTAEGASIGIKGPSGGTGDFLEATSNTNNTVVTDLVSNADWPSVNYQFKPPSDTITFYSVSVSKANANLNVQTDVKIIGTAP